ncbi:MAG: ABC transporter ATP-binding protein, partial [Pseudomonadota bacterium]
HHHLAALRGASARPQRLHTPDVDEPLGLADRVVELAPQPGRIAATLAIDLPRPRRRAAAAFADHRRALLDALARADRRC